MTPEQRKRIDDAKRAIEQWRTPTVIVEIRGKKYYQATMPPRRLFDELHAANMAVCK
jgi:hypothetical protein